MARRIARPIDSGQHLRRSALLVAVLLLLAVVGCSSNDNEQDPPPLPQGIVYDDSGKIWSIEPDGSQRRFLTEGTFPTMSPDGRTIVYWGNDGAIILMERDGTDQRRVGQHGYSFAYSPDGDTIIYVGPDAQLLTMNADGTDQKPFLADRVGDPSFDRSQGEPAYSPNGSSVVFQSGAALWLANADGSQPRQLTRDSFWNTTPVFAPDGQRVIFVSNRGGQNRSEIYDIDLAGNDVRLLVDHSTFTPALSPDHQQLVFGMANLDDPAGPTLQLIDLHDPYPQEPRPLTVPPIFGQNPSWAGQSPTPATS